MTDAEAARAEEVARETVAGEGRVEADKWAALDSWERVTDGSFVWDHIRVKDIRGLLSRLRAVEAERDQWVEARRVQTEVLNELGLLGSPVEELRRLVAEAQRLRKVIEAGAQTFQNISVETDLATIAMSALSAAILMRQALSPAPEPTA